MEIGNQTKQYNTKLYNHESIKPLRLKLRELKEANVDIEIEARSRVIQNNDLMKDLLLQMGQSIEKIYLENGMDFMIASISENVIEILEKDALEDLIDYAVAVLPDYYKNPKRSRAPQLKSQSVLTKLREESEKNIEEKFPNLKGKDDLKQAHDLKLQELKALEGICKEQEVSLLPDERSDESASYNQLNELYRLEKERFGERIPASPPLSTIDVTEEDIQILKSVFKRLIDTWSDVMSLCTEKYPPRTHETLMILVNGLRIFTQELTPYVDERYRRDIPQWSEIARISLETSPSNASRKSEIQSASIVDIKSGEPVNGRITKRHINSKIIGILNLINDSFKNQDNFLYGLSKVFSENAAPAREDRRIKLHDKLSYKS